MKTDLVDQLFYHAMKGEWHDVVKLFEDPLSGPQIQKAKITNSEDTALHIAISHENRQIVVLLVGTMKKNASEILSIRNKRGDTALHLAAALGDEVMCRCMAEKDPKLVASCNNEGETPIFLAALHGAKGAFSFLINYQDKLPDELKFKANNSLFRNRNGDTILHAALSGEYYELAYEMILKFPELVNFVNQYGQTPLHILASKPKAFYSSTRNHMTWLDRIIYSCVPVEVSNAPSQTGPQSTINNNGISKSSEISSTSTEPAGTQCHIGVNQQQQEARHQSKAETQCHIAIEENRQQQEVRHQPKGLIEHIISYLNPFTFLNSTTTMTEDLMSRLPCQGIGKLRGIIEKKKKHTWARRIMNQLVNLASNYKYNNTGGNPNLDRRSSDIFNDQTRPDLLNENTTASSNNNISDNKPGAPSETGEPNPSEMNHKTGSEKVTEVQNNKSIDKNKENRTGNGEDDSLESQLDREETAILVAARKGVLEIVEKILDKFPVAIQDRNSKNKNIVLLAVESRQTHIYQLLLSKRKTWGDTAFWQVDDEGNSALHLAAKCGEHQPWLIPGGALQMQWEFKWYKFVKKSMPQHFFVRLLYNNKGRTPKKVFTKTHRRLVEDGRQWLTKTSEACSVVAALIATVAFGASTAVPGGFNEKSGRPVLRDDLIFNIFAVSSLFALCFSVTALIFFLTILTSRYQEKDFANSLPKKLLFGLTSLFTSIAAILISFCSGHSFVLKDKLRFATYPIYLATCLPITYFALEQLPLYFDLLRAIFKKVPEPSHSN